MWQTSGSRWSETGMASAAQVGQTGMWPCQSSALCLCYSATAPCPGSKYNPSVLKWDTQYGAMLSIFLVTEISVEPALHHCHSANMSLCFHMKMSHKEIFIATYFKCHLSATITGKTCNSFTFPNTSEERWTFTHTFQEWGDWGSKWWRRWKLPAYYKVQITVRCLESLTFTKPYPYQKLGNGQTCGKICTGSDQSQTWHH
jgi:hypothetical protein